MAYQNIEKLQNIQENVFQLISKHTKTYSRQLTVIHPSSKFKLFWGIFQSIIIILCLFIFPLELAQSENFMELYPF